MGREAVLGTALMLVGGNSRTVRGRVGRQDQGNQPYLTARNCGADACLNRTQLVNGTITTVATNLTEGALLVILVLFSLFGNFRAAPLPRWSSPSLC